jgi:hypothetical protein
MTDTLISPVKCPGPSASANPATSFGHLADVKDSRLSHLAKVEFQWFYWHFLLPERDIPGLGSAMSNHGKVEPASIGVPTQE